VSGRRNHPAAPPAEQLTALVGRLTAGDRQVCRLLADHQVLTTGLLALLLDAPPRTLQQRLTTLTTLKVVDRFRPTSPWGPAAPPTTTCSGRLAPRSWPPTEAPPPTDLAGIGRSWLSWRTPTGT
jgi:hypothetical protein